MKREKSSRKVKTQAKIAPKKVRRSSKQSFIIGCLLFLIITFIIILTIIKITEFFLVKNNLSKLPQLDITLADVPIETIDLNDKGIVYPNNSITIVDDNISDTFDNVEIKGRGNISWVQVKKPYQIKLPEKASVLGLNPAKKWLLLADYLDNSYLRNDTAFYLQHLLNSENPINGNFIELIIDNNYRGLYYLTEKVEISKNRINLKDPNGIIVELDNLHNTEDICPIKNNGSDCFMIHDSVNSDNDPESISDFIEKFNQLEIAINKQDFLSITEIADVDSFAKYFLLNEFANNPDGYGSSFFLYTDGLEDKIHAGAGWDFDLSFGNRIWSVEGVEDSIFLSPFNTMVLKDYLPSDRKDALSSTHLARLSPIFYNLMDIPEFAARVKDIYHSTISGRSEEILSHIESQANYIKDAAQRDRERWKLNFDFDGEVDYLIDWVAKRYDHFEETYGANLDS